MNIFVLDHSPMRAAQYHHDTHLRKMICESSQMLSIVIREHHNCIDKIEDRALYKYANSYSRHPCTRWAATSIFNFEWLHNLLYELLQEHDWRGFDCLSYSRERHVELIARYRKPAGVPPGS